MNNSSTLEGLAKDGSPESLMLMRVMVIKDPNLAPQALFLIADIDSKSAANTILGIMRDHPESAALEGVSALGKMNNDKALENISNFITSEDISPQDRATLVNHAFDVLRNLDNPQAENIEKKLLELDPLITALRIAVLEEEAIDGDIFAVDEIERIALISDGNNHQVLESLHTIGTDYATQAYKRSLEHIRHTGDLSSLSTLLEKHGIVFPSADESDLSL